MEHSEKLSFRIDSFTPETLPMARLAEYLSRLAEMYGNTEHVHFDRLKKGSAILQVKVDGNAFPKVWERLQNARGFSPDPEIEKAYHNIDKMLRRDNATGSISREKMGKIITFPGRTLPKAEVFSMSQPTTVDGIVIKIGGRDETIPVTIRDQEGRVVLCQIRGAARAKELAKYFLGETLRFQGNGKWVRDEEGNWTLEMFFIGSFEEIDDTPADVVLGELAAVPRNGWAKMDAPLDVWKKLRGSN